MSELNREILSIKNDPRVRSLEPVLKYCIQNEVHLSIVLEIAKDKLHAYPFSEVPIRWIVLHTICSILLVYQGEGGMDILDMAVMVAGSLISTDQRGIINQLYEMYPWEDYEDEEDIRLVPEELASNGLYNPTKIPIAEIPETGIDLMVSFQSNLDSGEEKSPMVFRGLIESWPACKLWNSSRYLLKKTRGGKSLVPIEVGSSYTSDNWSQTVISFKQYLMNYILLQGNYNSTGYLAQYNLFHQFPELKEDFLTPDLCHADAPDSMIDQPIINAWLGPKDTISPLHTDPYNNIFCQVVGYKYIRLYSPGMSSKMYPRTTTEHGINMSNTSQVNLEMGQDKLNEIFPDFPWDSQFVDTILGPGDALFIPTGWWHYIQSLSTSISISFWF